MPNSCFEISLEGIKISAVPFSLVVSTQSVEQVIERFGDEIEAQPHHSCHLTVFQPPFVLHVATATAPARKIFAQVEALMLNAAGDIVDRMAHPRPWMATNYVETVAVPEFRL